MLKIAHNDRDKQRQLFSHVKSHPCPQNMHTPFLSDPGVPGVRSMGPDLSKSLQDYFADLTDVTLADEDSNSTPADDVNRAILGNALWVKPLRNM